MILLRRFDWRVARVLLLAALLAIAIALVGLLLHAPLLSRSAVHVAMLAATAVALRWEHKPLRGIGIRLSERSFWRELLLGFAVSGISVGLVFAAMLWLTHELSVDAFATKFAWKQLGASLAFWLLVAAAEESLFRGYILAVLRERFSSSISVLISALLFMAIHFINPDYDAFAYLYALAIGVLLGSSVIRHMHLGWAIGFHFAWNLLQDEHFVAMPGRGGELAFVLVWFANLALLRFGRPPATPLESPLRGR
jgi:membrane protease YdiL (CAAX protease family)